MAHHNSNSFTSSPLSALLKEPDKILVHKIGEIETNSLEEKQILHNIN